VARYGGQLPRSAGELRSIPGVGRYTAGAIASIAYGEREPVVDGNVMRVLARVYGIDDDVKAAPTQKRLWGLAEQMVPGDAAGDFNQGLMELGATVCTPRGPSCPQCPVASLCVARADGRQEELPITPARKRADELPVLDVAAVWVRRRDKVLLVRRRAEGLFGGMWELPQADRADQLDRAVGLPVTLLSDEPELRHRQLLSHRRLRVRVWRARLGRGPVRPDSSRYDGFCWQRVGELDRRALAAGTARIAEHFALAT